MATRERIGFIGGGKMAEAIMRSLLGKQAAARPIVVSDISPERRKALNRIPGVQSTADNVTVLRKATVVFLAVKPQQLDDVTAEIAQHVRATQLVISIAAGKRLAYYHKRLPAGRIVRVMPNLAALVGASANAYCLGPRCKPQDRVRVNVLLASFGAPVELPERLFDGVTALSGSGPAFIARWTEAMVQGGMALGLREADARALAYQTLRGTAQLLLDKNGYAPVDLIAAVSSAKGTTVAGLEVLQQGTVYALVSRTLAAAEARSRELSKGG